MQHDEQWEIPADVAYAAAEMRAQRLTKALILSEAQVLTLQQRVNQLEERVNELEDQRIQQDTRVRDLESDIRLLEWKRGEVTHDATQDSPEGAAAGGEDGAPHPFHD